MRYIFLALGGLITFVLGQGWMMFRSLPNITDPNLAVIYTVSSFGLMFMSLVVIPLLVMMLLPQPYGNRQSSPKSFEKNDRGRNNKSDHRDKKKGNYQPIPDDVAQAMKENDNKQE